MVSSAVRYPSPLLCLVCASVATMLVQTHDGAHGNPRGQEMEVMFEPNNHKIKQLL